MIKSLKGTEKISAREQVKGINRAFTQVKLSDSRLFESVLFLHRIGNAPTNDGEMIDEANRILCRLMSDFPKKSERRQRTLRAVRLSLLLFASFAVGALLSAVIFIIKLGW